MASQSLRWRPASHCCRSQSEINSLLAPQASAEEISSRWLAGSQRFGDTVAGTNAPKPHDVPGAVGLGDEANAFAHEHPRLVMKALHYHPRAALTILGAVALTVVWEAA